MLAIRRQNHALFAATETLESIENALYATYKITISG